MVVRIIAFIGSIMFGAMFFALPAKAITLNPPIFEFQMNPGDSIEDVIKVFNDSADGPLNLIADVVNFTFKEGDETTGTPVYYEDGELLTGHELAPWVTISEPDFTVAPLVRKTVSFSIDVPESASPGSYFGGVILRSNPEGGSGGVGLSAGTAVMIILRVNGDANESAVLTDFTIDAASYSHLPVKFMSRVMNDGNVLLQPAGTVNITDILGRQVGVAEVNSELRGVLPGSARRFMASWGSDVDENASLLSRQWNNFKFGRFTATLNLEYGTEGKTFTSTQTFWVIPWLVLTVLIGGLVALIVLVRVFLGWYTKRIIKRYKTSDNG